MPYEHFSKYASLLKVSKLFFRYMHHFPILCVTFPQLCATFEIYASLVGLSALWTKIRIFPSYIIVDTGFIASNGFRQDLQYKILRHAVGPKRLSIVV
ncbi:hypothetical protein CYOC110262_16555 [Cytobacillus oceanisediminis]|uniref:Uncharacterized protein n=1 Tax=Cytobacillus oceanisediminis TaxID=665099 RepID=A0A562JCT7_9BACI|nr:hypothetical protein IQ19_04527 [Cytobacillus oceanisediminis]